MTTPSFTFPPSSSHAHRSFISCHATPYCHTTLGRWGDICSSSLSSSQTSSQSTSPSISEYVFFSVSSFSLFTFSHFILLLQGDDKFDEGHVSEGEFAADSPQEAHSNRPHSHMLQVNPQRKWRRRCRRRRRRKAICTVHLSVEATPQPKGL